jgi:hypothetical protein
MSISTQIECGKPKQIPEMERRFTPILLRDLLKTSVSLSLLKSKEITQTIVDQIINLCEENAFI